MRSLYFLGLSYLAVALFVLRREATPSGMPMGEPYVAAPYTGSDGAEWFMRAKPSCNSLEVETYIRRAPPPTSLDGTGYGAACWALGGRITEARAAIVSLPEGDRATAASIVFAVGHPVADMGDDRSAGPIMGLVVEFIPTHYMALYHAGAARFAVGDLEQAKGHLIEFLKYYHEDDGWTGNARQMLSEIGK